MTYHLAIPVNIYLMFQPKGKYWKTIPPNYLLCVFPYSPPLIICCVQSGVISSSVVCLELGGGTNITICENKHMLRFHGHLPDISILSLYSHNIYNSTFFDFFFIRLWQNYFLHWFFDQNFFLSNIFFQDLFYSFFLTTFYSTNILWANFYWPTTIWPIFLTKSFL